MRKQKEKRTLTNVLAALCFAMALALLLSSVGATLAKYIQKDQADGAAVAAPFYFTSDKLGEDNPYYQISEPKSGNTAEISFTLSNFIDQLRCSSENIQYTCRAVSGTDSSAAAISGTESSGTLSGEFQSNTVTLDLQKSDFGSEGIVTVIVQSTSPYEKTISAQFGFAVQQYGLQCQVTEQGNAVVLEVAGGDGGNVTVTWPDALSPDLSNDVFQGMTPGSVTFAAQPGVCYALTFLKTNSSDTFTKDSFTVTAS